MRAEFNQEGSRRGRGATTWMLAGLNAAVLGVGLLNPSAAMAAGGHHAVDDAAIPEPGLCKVEGWVSSEDRGERLVHAGSGCRVGPVELQAAAAYARARDASSVNGYGVQAKWATEAAPGLAVGLLASGGWQARAEPKWMGSTLLALFTWTASENVAVHLNVGRDFINRGKDLPHSGVAVEWTVQPGWSVVGERFVQQETHYLRAGLRWAFAEGWTVDFSRAHSLNGPFGSIWTLGTAWQFDRR